MPSVPDELKAHRRIRYRFASGARDRWELQSRDTSIALDVDGPLTLGSLNLILDAALAGMGIGWVPLHESAEHIAAGRLVQLLPEWCSDFGQLCLYYPANRRPPTALRLFAEAVREWARAAG